MKYFKEKIEKMRSEPDVKKQLKKVKTTPEIKEGKYAYDPAFLDEMLRKATGK
jgi:hypothetical protein